MRCSWAESHELLRQYHDEEWGVPVHDDRLLFEMLNLEGAQAGLSWLTVLKKRENYLQAFADFDAKKVAKFTSEKKAVLMKNEGIIRNHLKISAVIENAKAFLAVQKEFGSFDRYIWQFAEGRTPAKGKPVGVLTTGTVITSNAESEQMSKTLKNRGFKFVGPTICYAFMQAVGMVNDHALDCFRRKSV